MQLRVQNGFTLVEVLITLVLLTFGLIAAATVETASIQVNSRAARMDEATGLAQLTMEQLRSVADPATLADTVEAGLNHTGLGVGRYTRSWTITPGPTANSRRVRVTVSWLGGPGNNQVVLQGLATGGSL
jgi:type IV pilus assembly protein PilV